MQKVYTLFKSYHSHEKELQFKPVTFWFAKPTLKQLTDFIKPLEEYKDIKYFSILDEWTIEIGHEWFCLRQSEEGKPFDYKLKETDLN